MATRNRKRATLPLPNDDGRAVARPSSDATAVKRDGVIWAPVKAVNRVQLLIFLGGKARTDSSEIADSSSGRNRQRRAHDNSAPSSPSGQTLSHDFVSLRQVSRHTTCPPAGTLARPMALLSGWSKSRKVVIGMLHLPPLPGSPRYAAASLSADRLTKQVLADADVLADAGVQGLMLENFGDVPFFPSRVPAHVVAHMTAIALAIRERLPDLPLGVNVLRNDGQSALAIASAVGAAFIRVNVLCGARVTDQGILQGIAHDLLRDRVALGASQVRIMADVDVKHSAPLASIALEDEVEDTLQRGLADALIVSGSGTGKATDAAHVQRVKAAAGSAPVFVGSGVSPETIQAYLPHVDGFIIGTAFKKDGQPSNPVDRQRVTQLMSMVT